MSTSVVICAYTMDRWDDLVAAVQSSLDQSLRPDEVIVIVDYNEDLYRRAEHELGTSPVVILNNKTTKGLSGARNTGVAFSSGEIVAFLDDDAYAEHDWLERLVVPLADPMVAGVGGWVLPHWEGQAPKWLPESFYWILGCSYAGLPATNSRLRNPIGANMALRRSVFTQVGGFTSGIGRIGQIPLGCEETELCIRYTSHFSDHRFVLNRDAIVHHRVPTSRLTWHYFWTRCWAEGLSKALVSSLVGSQSGLASERSYIVRSLPKEFGRSMRMLPRHPFSALARSALIFAGTGLAVAGLLRGRLALRGAPSELGGEDLGLLQKLVGGGERSSGGPVTRRVGDRATRADL
jgi:glycosyltransferase involved in cell wall biosynthesis